MAINPKATISIGDLKHRIEIQRLTTDGVDTSGFHDEVWETIATPRCNVEFDDRLMREVIKDDGINTTFVSVFTFRFIKGITYEDRIFYKDKFYQIYGMNNVNEQSRFLKVWARGIS